jgi:aminopeptidase N
MRQFPIWLPPTVTLVALIAGMSAAPVTASAQTIGAYTPPRSWPERPARFDLIHQRIAISLDWAHLAIRGEVQTTVVATTATDTVRLDADHLTVTGATDSRGRKLRFQADTTHVTVRLARKAAPGDTVRVTVTYTGVPERGLYFVPRSHVAWTQGEAIETRSWVPTYDWPNDKATWEFLVTADSGMSVLSNGKLIGVTPAPGGHGQVWHWAQEQPASTYLYSVVIGPLTVLHDQWRGRPVDYWVAPDTVPAGWRTFGETPSMIEIYSQVLGVNYPWPKYSQAVIPDFTYGGMENVSATTQTDLVLHGAGGEPERSGRGLVAHELAHQWFGDLTTTATWSHAWLNEGLTTYMESVQNEKSRGWSAGQLSWYHQQQEAMGADLRQARPLVYGDSTGDPIQLFFTGHIYPKGAQVAHQLRRLLGDSLFWAGMRRFLTDNAYKPVRTEDFAIAFERTANMDLDWFFDQWCYGVGYPKVKVTRRWDAASHTLQVTVSQTQAIDSTRPVFRFPVTIRVITADSVLRREIMVTKQEETFALPLPQSPLSFRFDEGAWLLGTVQTDQAPAELGAMAMHDLEFGARLWALRALDSNADPAADSARRFMVLNERDPMLREEAMDQLAARHNPADLPLIRSALRDPASGVRGSAIEAWAALDSVAARVPARALLESDPNTSVRERAIAELDPADPAIQALLIARTAPGWPLGLRQSAAYQIRNEPEPGVVAALVALTAASEPRSLRQAGLRYLAGRSDKAPAIATATKDLGDPDPLFAVSAVQTLARIGGPKGIATLQQRLKVEHRVTVTAAIRQALAAPRPA